MSNFGQGLVAVVGGVVGFLFGGPLGASIGFQLGLLGGSALFPTQLPGVIGPRLTDEATTTSEMGADMPDAFGTIDVGGNTIWLGKMREESHTEEQGGKGGPTQSVETFTYFQSIAIRLTDCELTGIRRIWELGDLVYDIRPQLEGETDEQYDDRLDASALYAAGFVFYPGSETQMPDPTIELDKGVGKVPAWRGTAYIVYPEWQLKAEHGNRHPPRKFEVVRKGNYTLKPVTQYATGFVHHWNINSGNRDYRNFDNIHRYRLYKTPHSATENLSGPADDNDGKTSLPDGQDDSAFKYYKSLGEAFNAMDAAIIGNPLLDIHWPINNLAMAGVIPYAESRPPTEREDEYIGLFVGFGYQAEEEAVYNSDDSYYSWEGNFEAKAYTGPEHPSGEFLGFGFKGVMYMVLGGGVSGYPLAPIVGGGAIDGWYIVEVVAEGGSPSLDSKPHYSVTVGGLDEIRATVHFWKCAEIGIQRIPGPPPNVCENLPTSGGYCRDEFGNWYASTPWEPHSTGYVALQIFNSHNSEDQQGQVLGPIFDFSQTDHPDFDNEEKWTEAYLQEVSNQRMLPGKTYMSPLSQVFFDPSVYPQISTQLPGVNYPLSYRVVRLQSVLNTENVSLALPVSVYCEQAGLTPDEYDVSELLPVEVKGCRRVGLMPARSAIDVLRPVGWFDVIESERRLRFVRRGKAAVATLTDEDLGAHASGSPHPPLTRTRKIQDVDLPRTILLRYIDEARDYQVSEAPSPRRQITKAVNEVKLDVPVSLDRDHAAQCAEVVWADAWRSRWVHPLNLGRKALPYEPSDALLVPIEGRLQRLRVTSFNESSPMLRQAEMVRDDDGSYISHAVAGPLERMPARIRIWGQTHLLLLDLPALRDEDDDAGFYAAAWRVSNDWAGAVIHKSSDDGATFAQLGAITTEATIGLLASESGIADPFAWDEVNEILINMERGSVHSALEAAVLAGSANAAAIGAHGRWEIIQWHHAEQISPTQYKLTKLLRGRRGTEHLIGTAGIGDRFVMLNVYRFTAPLSERGAERIYKAVSINKPFASGVDYTFTGQALALKPFSPVDIEGERDGSDNLSITWTRRGRLGQELPSGADIPLSEETEAYEVDILGVDTGDSVVRTIEVASPTAVYSAAQQTTDFGSPQAEVRVKVYQISATVGRGTPGEATI